MMFWLLYFDVQLAVAYPQALDTSHLLVKISDVFSVQIPISEAVSKRDQGSRVLENHVKRDACCGGINSFRYPCFSVI